ncbi:MAG: EamA family transporter [Bilophila wadsworthia]
MAWRSEPDSAGPCTSFSASGTPEARIRLARHDRGPRHPALRPRRDVHVLHVRSLALLLGVFSSALPYGLEIVALKQLPAQTFGILMSMEPVLAALSGIIFLGEQLNVAQWVALACIIVASIGATLTIRRKA